MTTGLYICSLDSVAKFINPRDLMRELAYHLRSHPSLKMLAYVQIPRARHGSPELTSPFSSLHDLTDIDREGCRALRTLLEQNTVLTSLT